MNKYMQKLSDLLTEGLEKYANSDEYKNLLSVMGKFYSYSANNCILIATQCPDASYVAGYNKWHDDFHRQVKKGAHAIRIKSPMKYEDKETGEEKLGFKSSYVFDIANKWHDDFHRQVKKGAHAIRIKSPMKYEDKETGEEKLGFKSSYVFDIADTYQIPGKPPVKIGVEELHGTVKDYSNLISCLTSTSPVPVEFKSFKKSANGYFNKTENKIVVKDTLSELQSVKTLVHEIAHSLLHSDNPEIENEEKNREWKEFEAESVAFIVCKYLNLDTGEYSFPYILSWSKNQFQEFLKEDLPTIQKTANYIIDKLNEQLDMVEIQA